ncbi:MAG: hypothetical protein ACOX7F_07390 [Eubacteriales bacterium]|jgi:hypothetical protein
MFTLNCIRLAIRTALLGAVVYSYLGYSPLLEHMITFRLETSPWWMHLLWLLLMFEMLTQLIPKLDAQLGCGKQYRRHYQPQPYDEYRLLKSMMLANRRAAVTMLLWMLANSFFGLLYLLHIIQYRELLVLSFFFCVCDLVCVLFWCPFQYINKNRCCVTCRIYNWGFFMMYTPMLFIRSFFSWSLFLMGLVVLLFWEYMISRYPERFWEGSNQSLSCQHCTDKMCRIKRPYIQK